MSADTSTEKPGSDAEKALRDLAGTAYSQSVASSWLAATVLHRATKRRRSRRMLGGAAAGAVLVGSVAAATVGGGPYYEYRQPSAVMESTVPVGSSVVVNRDLEPVALDVVQVALDIDGRDVQSVLRVVGTAGDTVACPATSSSSSCTLTVNGRPIANSYVAGLRTQPFGTVKVPDNALFLLGDARNVAVDSRMLGPVPAADVNGVVVAVVDDGAKVWPVEGAPRHHIPDDYEVDPETPVPPASTQG
ncbi:MULTISPECIES: signal peptidase I [Nocardioides]|uniref:Signal peptidase I n=1 Tax=Nocardioides vastitatis TaxID=2568655 RepID=A0ABW0ZH89_9ACTN|nr:signal peptidase I [Nocardioides sp.]